MISCDEALDLLSAALDGPLTEDEQHMLEEHLTVCAPCRALQADLQTIHTALPGLNEPVPAGLTDRVLEQIHADEVVPLDDSRRKTGARRWRRWAVSAALFGVVLLGAGRAALSPSMSPVADHTAVASGTGALPSEGVDTETVQPYAADSVPASASIAEGDASSGASEEGVTGRAAGAEEGEGGRTASKQSASPASDGAEQPVSHAAVPPSDAPIMMQAAPPIRDRGSAATDVSPFTAEGTFDPRASAAGDRLLAYLGRDDRTWGSDASLSLDDMGVVLTCELLDDRCCVFHGSWSDGREYRYSVPLDGGDIVESQMAVPEN
ncbi:anti-sigma factor [Pseudoflavonifractor sp. MSJ-37]|uniref:anti-sigma factor n=1 Tax=Pseudoflavonifractor sp. MSJ-37 TaxID=2841531 RepID=UPI001C119FCF|nr:anti-sigma factor [Pseudoflavonifractor sp. MSJ-37]MBU5435152.1 zf-HC2 domain-containing protein [Pseudoflavonifractor sp. MSJ-37]